MNRPIHNPRVIPRWLLAPLALLLAVACEQGPTQIEDDWSDFVPQFSPTNTYPSAAGIYFTAGGNQRFGGNNPGSIQRLNTDGTGLTTIIVLPADSRPTGLAIDQANGHLYLNDWNLRTTQRLNLDGTGVTTINVAANCGLLNLALDVPGNKIYTTAGACLRRVSRFNLDGTGSFQVLVPCCANSFFPDGIALDLANGHVYYGDPGLEPTGIHRMNLNGSGLTTLISPDAFPPTNGCVLNNPVHGRGRGMALDLAAGKMYFAGHPRFGSDFLCPPGLGEIWSANLDGTGLTLLVGGLDKPDGVALDLGAGKMYWTDGNAGKIQRANLDGSNVQDVLTGILTPRALVLEPSPIIEVDIDIKPGSDPNSINLGNNGNIPVAILTTDDFDAADVDAGTVTLGNDDGDDTSVATSRNGSLMASLEDVDDDEDLDLVLHFETQALVGNGDLDENTTELTLNGETTGGQAIQGSGSVNIVP